MKLWNVSYSTTNATYTTTIDADDEDEAIDAGLERLAEDGIDLSSQRWGVDVEILVS